MTDEFGMLEQDADTVDQCSLSQLEGNWTFVNVSWKREGATIVSLKV